MLQSNLFSRPLAQVAVLSILSGMVVLTGMPMVARAGVDPALEAQIEAQKMPIGAKQAAIDSLTDNFFYQVNPELNKRKLRSSDKAYIREWQAIREVVATLVKSSSEVCFRGRDSNGNYYWEFDYRKQNGGDPYDYLTDVIYYHRNPDMAGMKLRPGTASARAWSSIRRKLNAFVCGI
jgi:hypothetical protein